MADTHIPTTLVDWLDDLTVRFILNLPASELSQVPRLCFQVEEAQWYYEDFVRPAVAASGAPPLPSLPLRQFLLLLFQHCPLFKDFSAEHHMKAYEEFLAYKVRVPVRGAILLDERMEKVVLVRGWKKGASWSFPRGKINKDEKDLHCAIREVWEETGFDIKTAGLVPENEDDAKAIDVTMREQHMRLFVFRGVPEDTPFEPKTRKEISKISWYSIKDLPGFKKQKAGQPQPGGDTANANKFYMVAPFLGHLKKWINQQHKVDNARAKRASNQGQSAHALTEDEGEVDDSETPDRDSGIDIRSEELKKMLSIGGSFGTENVQAQVQQQENKPTGAANLLALLQGNASRSSLPHTPMEQVKLFPQQPESPHPHYARNPSTSAQQQPSPPRFPIQPPGDSTLPTPHIFNAPQNGFRPPNFPSNSAQDMPPHLRQNQLFHPPIQSVPPAGPSNRPQLGSVNGTHPQFPANSQSSRTLQQQPPIQMLPAHSQQPPDQRELLPQHAHMAPQRPQGAMGSGPAVPNASQLPAPRQLGQDKMRLLDAFRGSTSQGTRPAPTTSAQPKHRPASTHQTALLDLFRKPSDPSASRSNSTAAPVISPQVREPSEPVSPTGTDITVKPSATRRSTLNEITRTLPPAKAKSPPVLVGGRGPLPPQPSLPEPRSQAALPSREREQRPHPLTERQLFDPNNPMKFVPATVIQKAKQDLPAEMHKRRSHEMNQAASPSPSRQDNGMKDTPQNGARATPPPFTILARPGSAKGQPRSPVPPHSPSRVDASKPAFQPQVLKRPKGSDTVEAEQKPADKKDQLLALFGKSAPQSPASTRPAPIATPPPVLERKESSNDSKNCLLDLLNTSSSVTTPKVESLHAPPPAPRIEPEKRPTSTRQQPTLNTAAVRPLQKGQQQNLLLDLFSSKRTGTPMTSPGTPISPFTLGTPAVEEQKRRMGSLSGLADASAPVPASSRDGAHSPQEKKDFLMGFLNGVVKNEGRK